MSFISLGKLSNIVLDSLGFFSINIFIYMFFILQNTLRIKDIYIKLPLFSGGMYVHCFSRSEFNLI